MNPCADLGPKASFLAADSGGRILAAHQPDLPLVPASNNKLFIAAATLLDAGLERPLTGPLQFLARGQLDHAGILHGQLIIRPDGNLVSSLRLLAEELPASLQLLDRLAAEAAVSLRAAGALGLHGSLAIDCPPEFLQPFPQYPCASLAAFNDNTIDILATEQSILCLPRCTGPFQIRPEATVLTQERHGPLIHVNTARPSRDFWRLDGECPPTEWCRQQWTALLSGAGWPMTPAAFDPQGLPPPRPLCALGQGSTTATSLLPPALLHSDNFRAELAALLLCRRHETSPAQLPDLVTRLLSAHDLKLPATRCHDGSGLSRANRCSAADLITLHRHMMQGPCAAFWQEHLPLAGRRGTLLGSFLGTALEGRLIAKTGTLDGIRSLSGFLLQPKGPPLFFAFIDNSATDLATFHTTLLKIIAPLQKSWEFGGEAHCTSHTINEPFDVKK